jgi:hypothetical protein
MGRILGLVWYTVMIHCDDTLWWYTVMMHYYDTLLWYTVTIHYADTLWWYCDDTLWWYAVMMHCCNERRHLPERCSYDLYPLHVIVCVLEQASRSDAPTGRTTTTGGDNGSRHCHSTPQAQLCQYHVLEQYSLISTIVVHIIELP